MRAQQISTGDTLIAETSKNGTHLIIVCEIARNETPARVFGKILHIIKPQEEGTRPIKIGDDRDYSVRNCYPQSEIGRFLS